MQAIATLLQDDPYLKMPAADRLAKRRSRRERISARGIPEPVALPPPEPEPEPEPVLSMADWVERQKQIPMPAPALKALPIRAIQVACAKHYGITLADILSPSRKHHFVRARQVGMYLASKITGQSSLRIGRFFGGRDHATSLWAIRKIERLILEDQTIAGDIAAIKSSLGVA